VKGVLAGGRREVFCLPEGFFLGGFMSNWFMVIIPTQGISITQRMV
jgi:hypothetical protein